MTETKLLLNSVTSDATDGAKFVSIDLKDMFLNTPMEQPEYMKVHLKFFSLDIIKRYNLQEKVHSNGYVYIEIIKGLYGLKQVALLAHSVLSNIKSRWLLFSTKYKWTVETYHTTYCF